MGCENSSCPGIIDVSRLGQDLASICERVRIDGQSVASALKSRRDLALENVELCRQLMLRKRQAGGQNVNLLRRMRFSRTTGESR